MAETDKPGVARDGGPTSALFDTQRVKRSFLDLRYGPEDENMLDIYLPDDGPGPFPAVVYIHGGGWMEGTRRFNALESIYGLLRRGRAIVSIDYRLKAAGAFPENLRDVKAALCFIEREGARYMLDSERVTLCGDSAGGHLSMLAALTQDRPEYGVAGRECRVRAVVSLFGPSDLTEEYAAGAPDDGDPMRLMGLPGRAELAETVFRTSDPGLLRLMSPIYYVTQSCPPMLFLHGTADVIVPCAHSIKMAARINELCPSGRAELRLFEGRVHSDIRFMCDETAEMTEAFLALRGL